MITALTRFAGLVLRGLFALMPPDPWLLRLYAAVPTGRWHPFAEVTLRQPSYRLVQRDRSGAR